MLKTLRGGSTSLNVTLARLGLETPRRSYVPFTPTSPAAGTTPTSLHRAFGHAE